MKKGIAITSGIFILVTSVTAMLGMGFATAVLNNFLEIDSQIDRAQELSEFKEEVESSCNTLRSFGGDHSSSTDEYELQAIEEVYTENNRLQAEFEDGDTWESETLDCDISMDPVTEEGFYRFEIRGDNGQQPSLDIEPDQQ